MFLPRTYHHRLILYVALLLSFLFSTLFLLYESSRSVIMEQADRNIERVTRQIQSNLQNEMDALSQRVKMLRNSIELSEYMFIVVSVDTELQPLHDLFMRQFGWLPVHRSVILSNTGRVLLGEGHKGLIRALYARNKSNGPYDANFYFYEGDTIEMVAVSSVYYQKDFLGTIAISQALDTDWMNTIAAQSDGHLFIARSGRLLRSTLEEGFISGPFSIDDGIATFRKNVFHVRPIVLEHVSDDMPQLWFGLSEAKLMRELEESKQVILVVAVSGGVGILLVGMVVLRNFSAPLRQLINTIQDVGEGRFPDLPVTNANDEIAVLRNQFSKMIQNLKEKQDVIDNIHDQLETQATTDALTGLYNRRHLYDLFPKLSAEASRVHKGLVIILADLDKFKDLNDRYGHLVGDECLSHFSDVLKQCCRTSDFIFRMGGEEFLVLSIGTFDGGLVLAEKIRTMLERMPLTYNDKPIRMTVSVGVAYAPGRGKEADLKEVIRRADIALYQAKGRGRNCVAVAEATA